ncbi:MAG: twin-arginine translocase TatA/TatE family subunit [Selenomonadaceae bacterium]|nr:twin-arginine translocase TatA/TatE family subunit [Selenomonadaceae bacterium]MBR1860034.1 twin-arginine translocase TatA/TatE family subunit [Selenomonadaceae bacterium]
MFGIGAGEFILILIVGLIVFGPNKLPEVGRSLGKLIREFRKAQSALSATLAEVDISSTAPAKTNQTNQNAQTTTQNEFTNNTATQTTPTDSTTSTAAAVVSTPTTSETTKPPTIEEVTEMIKSNPIKVPASKVDLSKETVDNKS